MLSQLKYFSGQLAKSTFVILAAVSSYYGLRKFVADEKISEDGVTPFDRKLFATDLPATNSNSVPIVVDPLPDMIVTEDETISLPISYDAFYDADADELSMTVKQDDGGELPEWMTFKELASINEPRFVSSIDIAKGNGLVKDKYLFYIGGHYVYAIDIDEISQPRIITSIYVEGDYGRRLTLKDNYLFVGGANTQEVTIVDISTPASPNVVKNLHVVNGYGVNAAVEDRYMYLGLGSQVGIKIYDISDFDNPSLVGSLETYSGYHLLLSNHYLFVADINSVKIVDVSDPSDPILVKSFGDTDAYNLALNGNILYVATGRYDGLRILDVSDLMNPSIIFTYKDSYEYPLGPCYSVAFQDNKLFATFQTEVAIFNVEDPYNIEKISKIQTNDTDFIMISGSYAYISDNGQLKIYQINSDQILQFVAKKENFYPFGGNIDITVTASDGLASAFFTFSISMHNLPPNMFRTILPIISQSGEPINSIIPYDTFIDNDHDTLSLNIRRSNGELLPEFLHLGINPVLVRTLFGDKKITSVAIVGEKACIGIDGESVAVIDISDPTAATLMGTYGAIKNTQKLVAIGNNLFVADDVEGLKRLDIEDGNHPGFIGEIAVSGAAKDVSVIGNRAYIADEIGAVHVADDLILKNNPILIANCTLPDSAVGIDSDGKNAYIAALNAGIQVANITVPANITLSSNIPTSGEARSVKYREQRLFVAANDGGMDIIDVANREIIGNLPISGNATRIDLMGDFAFIANSDAKLFFADVSDLTNPNLLGSFDSFGQVYQVAIKQNSAFMATATGFKIVDVGQYVLSGTPSQNNAGNYALKVSAYDPMKQSATTSFSLRVEGPPKFSQAISNQRAKVNRYYSFFFASETFIDPNGDALFYTSNTTDNAWPSWLNFNPRSGTFFGTPLAEHVGQVNITLVADDRISGTDSTSFIMDIIHVPTINKDIRKQYAVLGHRLTFTFDADTFQDLSGRELTYSATLQHGVALPEWLSFDSASRTFVGMPQSDQMQDLEILVTATNGEDSVTTSFILSVIQNTAPTVLNTIITQKTATGQRYEFPIPANTFYDPNGDTLQYEMLLLNPEACRQVWPFSMIFENELVEGSWPFWLEFNNATRVLSGTAPSWVAYIYQDKKYSMQLKANDGLMQGSLTFDLILSGPSFTESIITTAFWLLSIWGTAQGFYAKRNIILNNFFKNRFRRDSSKLRFFDNEVFRYSIELNAEKIGKIQVLMTKNKKAFQLTSANSKEDWMKRSMRTNELTIYSDRLGKDPGTNFTVRVYDTAGIIREEITKQTNSAIKLNEFRTSENPLFASEYANGL